MQPLISIFSSSLPSTSTDYIFSSHNLAMSDIRAVTLLVVFAVLYYIYRVTRREIYQRRRGQLMETLRLIGNGITTIDACELFGYGLAGSGATKSLYMRCCTGRLSLFG